MTEPTQQQMAEALLSLQQQVATLGVQLRALANDRRGQRTISSAAAQPTAWKREGQMYSHPS